MFKSALRLSAAAGVIFGLSVAALPGGASAEEAPTIRLVQSGGSGYYRYDRTPSSDGYVERGTEPRDDTYRPPRADAWRPPPQDQAYDPAQQDGRYASQDSGSRYGTSSGQYGEPYNRDYGPRDNGYYPPPREYDDGTFSSSEILGVGHRFFGTVSKGLASVIEYAFRKQGRPNGYILGEDLGGAFVAGLRYGEGWMYTRDAGRHKVFWQGPSIGYDAGADGSRVMVLVYNLRDPYDIYHRYGGVAGSAYVVGGAGITFQTWGNVVLAPIRAGVGLRFGANVGYLKYTPRPTWNPF